MAIRTPEKQANHNKMVKAMVDKFEKEGMTVKAAHIGHKNGEPKEVCGHIPDVEATLSGKRIIAEAETIDSFNCLETKEQFLAFSKVNAEFHVIVPKDGFNEIQKLASSWGAQVDKFWYLEE